MKFANGGISSDNPSFSSFFPVHANDEEFKRFEQAQTSFAFGAPKTDESLTTESADASLIQLKDSLRAFDALDALVAHCEYVEREWDGAVFLKDCAEAALRKAEAALSSRDDAA